MAIESVSPLVKMSVGPLIFFFSFRCLFILCILFFFLLVLIDLVFTEYLIGTWSGRIVEKQGEC